VFYVSSVFVGIVAGVVPFIPNKSIFWKLAIFAAVNGCIQIAYWAGKTYQ
jgi:uncharacterized membrane protein HdeD (DUF308 family)